MATSPTYCTHRDLKDVYPNLDEFDAKTPIYGWVEISSNKYAAHNSGLVTQLFVNGEDLGPAQSAHTDLNVEGEWFYNSSEDVCYYYSASTPLDKLMEAGEEFSTLITRIMKNASRYFDSRVDGTLPRDQWKDKEGNYDYLIIRTVALIAVSFLIKSHDPNSPALDKLEEEYNMSLGLINGGQAKLSYQNTADSSKGILREVGTISGAIRPVDTRGNWYGTYDVLKIKITTAGVLGTATYSVWGKNSDKLGINEGTQIVTDEKINGDYQSISSGLQIRFAGSAKDSTASLNDEWELEVFGAGEEVDNPVVRSVKMTRGWSPNRYR
jgi:hypothetical protein